MTAITSYLVGLTLCCAAGALAGKQLGRGFVIGGAVATSLLSASWFHWKLGDLPLSVQTSVTILVMLAYCIHSGKRIWSPLSI
ncbi:MAG: hypothetical protein AAF802_33170, partial [Planctomycetota bacterium]